MPYCVLVQRAPYMLFHCSCFTTHFAVRSANCKDILSSVNWISDRDFTRSFSAWNSSGLWRYLVKFQLDFSHFYTEKGSHFAHRKLGVHWTVDAPQEDTMAVYLVKLLLLLLLASLLFISCDHKAGAFVHHSGSTVRSTTGHAKYSHRRIAYYSNSQSTFQLQLLRSGDIELNPGPSSQANDDPKNSHLKCILLNSRSIVNKTLHLQA